MKFSAFVAVAAGLAAAAPRINLPALEVAVLGGSAFKVNQVPNKNYKTLYRGPRALAKAYQKFGVPIPSDLLQLLQQILTDLGISIPGQGGLNGGLGGNDTSDAGQGR